MLKTKLYKHVRVCKQKITMKLSTTQISILKIENRKKNRTCKYVFYLEHYKIILKSDRLSVVPVLLESNRKFGKTVML